GGYLGRPLLLQLHPLIEFGNDLRRDLGALQGESRSPGTAPDVLLAGDLVHAVVNEDHAEGDPQRQQSQRIPRDGIAQHKASTKMGKRFLRTAPRARSSSCGSKFLNSPCRVIPEKTARMLNPGELTATVPTRNRRDRC